VTTQQFSQRTDLCLTIPAAFLTNLNKEFNLYISEIADIRCFKNIGCLYV